VQPDKLDQGSDLRLGAAHQDGTAVRPQPARDHGDVEHQRRVGEDEIAQVDDHV